MANPSEPYFGKNKNGENIMVVTSEHDITITTFQKNGWVRTNVYYDDGTTEEYFSS